jgi:hypothetical protein
VIRWLLVLPAAFTAFAVSNVAAVLMMNVSRAMLPWLDDNMFDLAVQGVGSGIASGAFVLGGVAMAPRRRMATAYVLSALFLGGMVLIIGIWLLVPSQNAFGLTWLKIVVGFGASLAGAWKGIEAVPEFAPEPTNRTA